MNAQEISFDELEKMLADYYECGETGGKGKYYAVDRNGHCTAVDNSTGDMWVEAFKDVTAALIWLAD